MSNLIRETADSNDTRELPSENGPRGVEPASPPISSGGLTVPGEGTLQQGLAQAQSTTTSLLGDELSTPTGVGEADLTPVPVGNPLADPSTYSDAFTREAQDRASALQGIQGYVPTFAGQDYSLPELELPRQNALAPLQPDLFRKGGTNRGEKLGPGTGVYYGPAFPGEAGVPKPEEFQQFGPQIDTEIARLRERGLRTTTGGNVAQQGARGIGGLLGLGRRAVTGLFRGANRAGEVALGEDNEQRGFLGRAIKDLSDVSIGGSLAVLLNKDARRAFTSEFGQEFTNLGANEQETIRQLTPTNGAGNAGKSGPLSGDFGEYGTSWLGGVQYVLDGLGNQVRAEAATRKEIAALGDVDFTGLNRQQRRAAVTARIAQEGEIRRRNARAAWMGKDFSFLNPDSPITVFDKDAPKSWRTPFKVVGGIVLDTVTGPDPGDIIGAFRRPAGKAADALGAAAKNAPTSPTTGGALVRRPQQGIVPAEPGGVLDRINIEARPYPVGLPPSPRGGELARRTPGSSSLARDVIELDPYPVPKRLAQGRRLPAAPNQNLLPGTAPTRALPPGGGLDVTSLVTLPRTSPSLDAIRVVPDVSGLGKVDRSPALPRPVRQSFEVIDFLENPGELPLLDLNTGRITKVVEPDTVTVRPTGSEVLDLDADVARTPTDFPQDELVAELVDGTPDARRVDAPAPELDPADSQVTREVNDFPQDELVEDALRGTSEAQQAPSPTRQVETPTEQVDELVARRVDDGVTRELDDFPSDELIAQAVQDEFTLQVRANRELAGVGDVDFPRKVLTHAEAAGTVVTTNKGALVRADEVAQAAQRKLQDVEFKQARVRELGDDAAADALQAAAQGVRDSVKARPLREVRPNQSRPSNVSPVLTPDEVDELVPPVTVRQVTPVRRANQAVQELRTADLLQQAFDLKAIERTNLVRRSSADLEALARFMNHWTSVEPPSWADLKVLHNRHGLYATNGPALNARALNRAVEDGVRRIQQVEPNELLGVVGQSTVVRATPQVMGNKFNRAAFNLQEQIGAGTTGKLVRGEPLTDSEFFKVIDTWTSSGGRSSERRNLNALFGPGGYRPTPNQVESLKARYGELPRAEFNKLPKKLRDLVNDPVPAAARALEDATEKVVRVGDELLPVRDAEAIRAGAIPPELRNASDELVVRQAQVRQQAVDVRQSIVELESDLSQVQRQQGELYQELVALPELEPRSVMDGTWEGGRLNEKVADTVAALDEPVVRKFDDYAGPTTTLDGDDWFHGSAYAGGFDSPAAFRPGAASPLRGATPPGFMVLSNDTRLAEALAKGRVPENVPVTDLVVSPAVDKVYPTPQVVLDGNLPLESSDLQNLTLALVEATPQAQRQEVLDLLRSAKLDQAPLGRVITRLQDAWAKANPGAQIDDALFANLALGYKRYVGSVGDAVQLDLPGGRQVLLMPDPGVVGTNHIRTTVDELSPSDLALHRTYADEVLAEPGTQVAQVLNTNNRHQYALESAEELSQEIAKQNRELGRVLTEDNRLKTQAQELADQVRETRRAQVEAEQTKRIQAEYDQIDERAKPNCL